MDIPGETGASLTIDPVGVDDAGSYDVLVSNLCGSVTSDPATLGVFDPCDMNCDGKVNAFDIEPFLDLLFGGGKPCAPCTGDVNGDGSIDSFDIEPFIDCLFP